jgi:glycosyltransferase involved in cell wall biosynthesis
VKRRYTKSEGPVDVSAVIRVRNAAADLARCLAALRAQTLPASTALELIVVDNESTDGSVEVALQHGALIVPISQAEFSWGRALNLGIGRSRGTIVLLLSADVEPVGRNWLEQMLTPLLATSDVAAAYGRQIPRHNAPVDEILRLQRSFPAHSSHVGIGHALCKGGELPFLSNACAALKRSAWEHSRFDELCQASEEQPWMAAQLAQGLGYLYVAEALAYHSHRDPVTRGAYRLWEIHREGAKRLGTRASIANTLYAAGSIGKRRVLNVLSPNVPLRARVEGVLMLPLQVASFLAAAALEGAGVDRRKVRRLMWSG